MFTFQLLIGSRDTKDTFFEQCVRRKVECVLHIYK